MTSRRSLVTLLVLADPSHFGAISKWLGTEANRTVRTEASRTSVETFSKDQGPKWMLYSKLRHSHPLSKHIEAMAEILERRGGVPSDLAENIRGIIIFCKFSSKTGQGSAALSAELMGRLANQRTELVIDLYPPPKD